jgi:primosomal protein N' (replication factor Y)
MASRFCEVAVSVPVRNTFAYSIPSSLQDAVVPGSRVVVPFRKRALVGVVLALSEQAPKEAQVREIVELLDPIPAVPPKLIELGQWVAQYYLAPPGEVFRGILPPATDIRHERELFLTEKGRQHIAELSSRDNRS